jgi:hypothetical protein
MSKILHLKALMGGIKMDGNLITTQMYQNASDSFSFEKRCIIKRFSS